MRLYTIGFAGKSAREFFGILAANGVRRIIDIRLSNQSQLAGFTKQADLEYFLKALCDIEYAHDTGLAPTHELFKGYRGGKFGWEQLEKEFKVLLESRNPAGVYPPESLDGACLLCSEAKPDECHRRLVAEYFAHRYPALEIRHL